MHHLPADLAGTHLAAHLCRAVNLEELGSSALPSSSGNAGALMEAAARGSSHDAAAVRRLWLHCLGSATPGALLPHASARACMDCAG